MAGTSDLTKLAQKLASEGPHKIEATPRRVRALFGGSYVLDTTKAYHVWEHPYYPQFYIPSTALTPSANLTKNSSVSGTSDKVHFGTLSVTNKTTNTRTTTDRILIFSTKDLKDLVKIDFAALDQWFEEDVPIYQHPKDPYKRIDILSSTRPVKVALDGVTLAESSSPLFLLETTLRTRYYLPPTSVNWEVLSKSDTITYCPYKGRANYYNVTINGKEYKDLVWYYQYPTAESATVVGHLCFYNEKVDVWVDGVKEER
ncbi:DUF427-domain-containing protein [Paraphaeosphaeria sporulosa]|uniref:DUF427-domain-containing protein n=1 Tax=Paraphaeosphaeria sporulosa TaxID=1460663 RepID=A0A177CRN4_9PLEO|nr:DUF427-domain-containing protein [Paraphaeosphaeria sporulosa]OAG09602.1 DUF427-domain-containing protein [Paraphaeosphaeria sporulosa]